MMISDENLMCSVAMPNISGDLLAFSDLTSCMTCGLVMSGSGSPLDYDRGYFIPVVITFNYCYLYFMTVEVKVSKRNFHGNTC